MIDRFSTREDFQSDSKRLREEDKVVCICPSACDCQKPDGDGVRLLSDHCPIHNEMPTVDPDCPAKVHKNGALEI